ncbi:ABC transporter ATP-binding protein [Micromonospora coxensis]|uniref:ATP-binding cassette, subfamily B n=1 Tax=Micromonospora coxensis TaxID=356852 RepID=A0A1C5K2J8_9ACTN|nr:ABC transporter ATP-binding protein [Micromonospora coxensis]SCG77012.1 ATP-binding cassette, subfamily B [Micromonospora coxensis]
MNTSGRSLADAVFARFRIAGLLPYAGVGPTAGLAAVNLLLGLLPVAFVVATSVMLGRIPPAVAVGVGSPEWSGVVWAFVVASGAFALQQSLSPLQAALSELVARRVDGRIFDRLMGASLRSPGIAPLEDQRLLDDLAEASHELEHGFQSPGRACAGLLNLIARVTALLGYVIVIGLAFAWWAAAAVLVAVLAFRYGQRGGLRRYSQVVVRFAAARRKSRYFRNLAMGGVAAKEIRVFGLVEWLRDQYADAYREWTRPVWAARRRILLRPYGWYTVLGLATTSAVLVATARAGLAGMDVTSLVLVLQAVLGAMRLGEFYPEADVQTQFGMNAFRAVRAFERAVDEYPAAAALPSVPAGERLPTVPAPRREIRFSDLTFRYPGQSQPVYEGLNLVVPAGRCTAIVGVNGAGKTTLVKLLARLYDPQQGAVTVDGTDLRAFPVDAWRARLAVIFQDFNRYEVSAADNIAFGAVEYLGDVDRIRAAAADAGIQTTLEGLPAGFGTPLARHVTGGADLSGGQWQRVALARALFALRSGASVLVLDEPTASLDVRAESRFFDEFVRLTGDATTILISHRFSTVRHADHIIVLDSGRVHEEGSHEELIRRNGRYAELFRLQADRFADDEPQDEHSGVTV